MLNGKPFSIFSYLSIFIIIYSMYFIDILLSGLIVIFIVIAIKKTFKSKKCNGCICAKYCLKNNKNKDVK